MFAVIKTGGKQYRVAKGDKLVVEKLSGEVGSVIQIGNVLMIGEDGKEPTIGAPVVERAAEVCRVSNRGALPTAHASRYSRELATGLACISRAVACRRGTHATAA